MTKLEQKLVDSGYRVVNDGYPSRDYKIEELAEKAIAPALEKCAGESEINFVTHSLGGILVRQYLSTNEIPELVHVVMLGPPNGGSEVVDRLGDIPGFRILNGDAGVELGTDERSIPNRLGSVDFDVGIIAGTRSINWINSVMIPGEDDGKVSVENTRIDGMNDHIEIPTSHPFMMIDNEVISQVMHYLANGEFNRDQAAQ